MAGYGFGLIRVYHAVLSYHIGWVAGDTVKRSRRENAVCFLDIPCDNADLVLQVVPCHAPGRHIRTLRLDLQPCEAGTVVLGLHEQGNDPRARSQIQKPVPLACPGKACQQYRIHAKAESSGMLNDVVAVSLQFVQALSRFKCRRHGVSSVLPESGSPVSCRLPGGTWAPAPALPGGT